MSVINTNITSMIGQQNLNKSQNALQTSMERLSSGLRINSAKDDAAGQAIANRMTAQINGLAQAQRNSNDGISIAQTAEGGLNQVNDNLQRIRELTVQAANGTNSTSDLQSIQDEVNQRLEEINRISRETDFNGTRVLSEDADTLTIQVGSQDGQAISINLSTINAETLGLGNFDVRNVISSDNLSAAINEGDDAIQFAITEDVTVNANGFTPDPVGVEGIYALQNETGAYAIEGDDGNYYRFELNSVTGEFTWDSAAGMISADEVDIAGGTIDSIDLRSENVTTSLVDAAGDPVTNDFSGVTLDTSQVFVRNDVDPAGNTRPDTYAINFAGEDVADGVVSFIDANDQVQYAVNDGADSFLITLDANGAIDSVAGAALTGADLSAAQAGSSVSEGDIVVQAGFDITTASYGNYALEGSDGNYYAADLAVDTTAGGFNPADATSWSFNAVVDPADMQQVSAGNVVTTDSVVASSFDIDNEADLFQTVTQDIGAAVNAISATGDVFEVNGVDGVSFAVEADGGVFYAASDNGDGTFDWSSAGQVIASGDIGDKVDEYVTSSTDDATFTGLAENETLHRVLDSEGNDTGNFVARLEDENGRETFRAVEVSEPDVDGLVTVTDRLDGEGNAIVETIDPMGMLDSALNQVDSLRSELGAVQNRFEDAITNLSTNETNLAAARSRIEDADYAMEVADMTRAQILQQAGTSVLAQANQLPQNVLSLLG